MFERMEIAVKFYKGGTPSGITITRTYSKRASNGIKNKGGE